MHELKYYETTCMLCGMPFCEGQDILGVPDAPDIDAVRFALMLSPVEYCASWRDDSLAVVDQLKGTLIHTTCMQGHPLRATVTALRAGTLVLIKNVVTGSVRSDDGGLTVPNRSSV